MDSLCYSPRRTTCWVTVKFYLGTHHTNWLTRAKVPLFVSERRLRRLRSLPRATDPWCLDSGAFSELSLHGKFETPMREYADHIERYADEIGSLQWAAPQDWMCEPFMLKKTGLTIDEHQRRTVNSVIGLRSLTDAVRVIPVVQGWRIDDYLRHFELYENAGITLNKEAVVGLGSVCRRQGTPEIFRVAQVLWAAGLRLHGFGVKTLGLERFSQYLVSADSMAWSFHARRKQEPFFRTCTHKNCANCLDFALWWYGDVCTRALETR